MYNHPTLTIFGSYGIFFSRPGPRNFDRLGPFRDRVAVRYAIALFGLVSSVEGVVEVSA